MYANLYDQTVYPEAVYPPPPSGPPPLPHQRFWRRFRSARRRTQWGLGCLTLLLVMSICTCAVGGAAAKTAKPVATTAGGDTSILLPPTMQPSVTAIGSDASTPSPTTQPAATTAGSDTNIPSAAPTKGTTLIAPVATAPKQVTPTIPTPSPTPGQVPTAVPTATPTPVPQPTQPPAPQSSPIYTGVNGNPWGYDFTPGNFISSPPADFCTAGYFSCIKSFWKGQGYVDECVDGMYSLSGGIRGACSQHGGESQPLYSH